MRMDFAVKNEISCVEKLNDKIVSRLYFGVSDLKSFEYHK